MIGFRRFSTAAAVAAIACLAAPLTAAGHSYKKGDLTIGHPWSRATIGTTRPAVAYLTITNAGRESDRLVAVESPVAAHVHLHRSAMEGGVMKMVPVESVEIPVGGKVTLAPGGYHLMLMGLSRPLAEGERFPMTLTFEKAGKVAVEVKVEALGGSPSDDPDHGPNHGGH